MKINRWWYSNKQREIEKRFDPFHSYHVFVDGRWLEYTEWTTSVNAKCNWEDAVLIAESEVELPIMIDGVEQ